MKDGVYTHPSPYELVEIKVSSCAWCAVTSGWPCVVIRETRDVSGVLGISVEGIPLPLCRDGELRGDDEVVACGVRRRFFDCPITSEFASDAMVTGK